MNECGGGGGGGAELSLHFIFDTAGMVCDELPLPFGIEMLIFTIVQEFRSSVVPVEFARSWMLFVTI